METVFLLQPASRQAMRGQQMQALALTWQHVHLRQALWSREPEARSGAHMASAKVHH